MVKILNMCSRPVKELMSKLRDVTIKDEKLLTVIGLVLDRGGETNESRPILE